MPELKSGHIRFVLKPKKLTDHKQLTYEVNFLIGGEPVLQRELIDWRRYEKRPELGVLIFTEENIGGFIDVLKNVIESDKPEVWWDNDLPIIIEILPKLKFPFSLFNKDSVDKAIDENDPMTLIIQIDASHFHSGGESMREGFSFIIEVTRKELRTFMHELKTEIEYVKENFSYVRTGESNAEMSVPELEIKSSLRLFRLPDELE